MVSERHPHLVPKFAQRLAEALGIPYVEALRKTRATEEQKGMNNSSFQAKNLDASLDVIPFVGMERPGLFVDDMYDSGWTVTVAIALLRQAGAGVIFPFTLSKASGRE
jgi:ATP-dependent DNA helicase RecQ